LVGKKRRAISRTVLVLVIVAVLLVGVGEYVLNSSSSGPREIDIRIVEDDPVLQLDHFYPDNATAKFGENVTLAIQNGDDEFRYFILSGYNVNESMPAGTSVRVIVQMNHVGTFLFYSPATPPSPVSQGRPGPYLSGNFTVTQ